MSSASSLSRWCGAPKLVPPRAASVTASVTAEEFPPTLAEDVLWRRVGVKLGEIKARSSHGLVDVLSIKSVRRGSPAARLGLATDDLVRAVNSMEVESMAQLRKAVQRAHASRRLVLLVQRGMLLEQLDFSL